MKIEHESDYRPRRAAEYPQIGDQLGAIADALAAIRAANIAGLTLPQSTLDWLDKIAAIKTELPKS